MPDIPCKKIKVAECLCGVSSTIDSNCTYVWEDREGADVENRDADVGEAVVDVENKEKEVGSAVVGVC